MKINYVLQLVLLHVSFNVFANSNENYEWVTIKKNHALSEIKVTGRVIPQEGAIKFESSHLQGRISQYKVKEGDQVKKGASLFTISSAECISLREEKKIAFDKSLSDMYQGLIKRESELGIKLNSDSCDIIATSSGVVTKRFFEIGALFNIGDNLMTILNNKRLTVEFDLPEQDLSKVHNGQIVEFKLASHENQIFRTTIKSIVPTVDPISRTVKVKVDERKLEIFGTLESMVFGGILCQASDESFSVPSKALVFKNNSHFLIIGPKENPKPIEVTIVEEYKDNSSIQPKHKDDLTEKDLVASKQVIFLMNRMADGSTL